SGHRIPDTFPSHLLTMSAARPAVDDTGMCDLASPLPGLFFVHLTARQRDRFQRFPEHPVLLGIGSKALVVQVLRHKSCTAVMLMHEAAQDLASKGLCRLCAGWPCAPFEIAQFIQDVPVSHLGAPRPKAIVQTDSHRLADTRPEMLAPSDALFQKN